MTLSQNNIFSNNKHIFLNYGRAAIKFLAEGLNETELIKGVLLPNYLCESIIQPFKETGIPYEFYKVNKEFQVILDDFEKKIKPNWIIYVLDFFNIRQEKEVLNYLKKVKKTNIIIEDITHSLFDQKEPIGHFQIASLRKWLGIPSGALIKDFYKSESHIHLVDETCQINENIVQQRFYAANLKGLYLKNQLNVELKSEFLDLFAKSEMILDKKSIHAQKIDSISKEVIKSYDFKSMMKLRKENYKILYNELSDLKEIEVVNGRPDNNKVPLGFPIKVHDRDTLRISLIEEEVYPPIHWPLPEELLVDADDTILNISKSILTLPCDQRYTEKDMRRMISVIKNHYRS